MIEYHKQPSDVLIIGAGLCGLNLAKQLQKHDHSCQILESRQDIGGRILSRPYQSADSQHCYDLGPAWFWPHNRHIRQLIEDLGLSHTVFEQFSTGIGLFEDSNERIQQTTSGMSMAGSFRLGGGMQSLTDGIVTLLKPETIQTGCVVEHIKQLNGHLEVRARRDGNTMDFSAQHVVIAVPPRVAVQGITFLPRLPDHRLAYFNGVQTWMAAQGKVIIEYTRPFWRSNGLSGDAFSLIGPIRELHDASSQDASFAALFGFLDGSALSPSMHKDSVKSAVIHQLTRLFGEEAETSLHIDIANWSTSPFTCTARDLEEAPMHSYQSVHPLLEPEWDDKLIWSGSETADARQQINGYLEGAIVASQQAFSVIRG